MRVRAWAALISLALLSGQTFDPLVTAVCSALIPS